MNRILLSGISFALFLACVTDTVRAAEPSVSTTQDSQVSLSNTVTPTVPLQYQPSNYAYHFDSLDPQDMKIVYEVAAIFAGLGILCILESTYYLVALINSVSRPVEEPVPAWFSEAQERI